jgi:putative transposase
MINREHKLPVVRQCELLGLARSTGYYEPLPVSEADLTLMRRIDELHLKWPFLGSRRLRDLLQTEGFPVGRKHVAALMRRMGMAALYRKPKTSTPGAGPAHRIYPYLLRNLVIDKPIRSGRLISPTFRWPRVSSTWWRSWIGRAVKSWPGVPPTH